ncbi:MAG: DUF6491 family protein [Bdellovibrionota bacterium]
MKVLLAALATFSFLTAASADCVSESAIRNYDVDGDNLILQTSRGNYIADVGVCPELRWADGIGFDKFSSVWVCDGDSVITFDMGGRATDRCTIWSLEKSQ